MYQKNENEGEGNRETCIKIDEENGEYTIAVQVCRLQEIHYVFD